MASLIFWIHFVFAFASHILVPVMIGGAIYLLLTWQLGFWLSGLILGASFFSATYLVNHITNPKGYCVLTDLENYYRIINSQHTVGRFLPRFYAKLKFWK